MARRVRRNKEHEALYKTLKEGEAGVFETYKDILMMAACIGVENERRTPFESSAEPIDWDIFSGKTDLPIVNAIALKETGDVSILLDDDATFDRKIKILEEYANGGMEELKRRLIDEAGDALDNLVALLYEQREAQEDKHDSLDEVVDKLFLD